MVLMERAYYTLRQVAQRWNTTEEEVLQWAITGNLQLAFYMKEGRLVGVEDEESGRRYRFIVSNVYLNVVVEDLLPVSRGHTVTIYTAKPATQDIATKAGGEDVTLWLFNPMIFDSGKKDRVPMFAVYGKGEYDSFTETKKGLVKHRHGEPPEPEITMADLLVLADELRRFEEEHPELTVQRDSSISKEFGSVAGSISRGDLLIGWKQIATYMGCSVDTAKRRSKKGRWLSRSPEGKPTAMSADIDRHMTSKSK